MKPKIKFLLKDENSKIPVKANAFAACHDVFLHRYEKKEDDFYVCYLGFSTEIPEGYKCVVIPRSSLTKERLIMVNSPGQIDSDYRGEWQMRLRAIPVGIMTMKIQSINFNSVNFKHHNFQDENIIRFIYDEFPFKIGDRIGQFYLEKIEDFDVEQVEKLSSTERNEGGYGSTGKS